MFEVEKWFSFEAGHVLPKHKGKCKNPHGHSYKIKISVRSENVSEQGMVIDFCDITTIVQPMINTYFDHAWLNDSLGLKQCTAENIAQWIYAYVKPQLSGLYKVTVYETDSSCASYFQK